MILAEELTRKTNAVYTQVQSTVLGRALISRNFALTEIDGCFCSIQVEVNESRQKELLMKIPLIQRCSYRDVIEVSPKTLGEKFQQIVRCSITVLQLRDAVFDRQPTFSLANLFTCVCYI